ncbi:MAG: ATP-binding protein [Cyclobacteriaceae bacterium]|nr:ATP-binding protein [Cyclobacteriaceae bacterium]
MEKILEKSAILVKNQDLRFIRSLMERIDWDDRLIGILGARGTGKTTLLLQRQKSLYGLKQEAAYITLDDIYFTENRLVDFAKEFQQQGGKALFIDEVHKYPGWAQEIKNIYDFHKELRIVFTGSSITDMLRQHADLSRRAVQYELPGLSFREYLQFLEISKTPVIRLPELIKNHYEIAAELTSQFKPLKFLPEYWKNGYYPFFAENLNTYAIRLEQVVKLIIENDLRFIEGFDQTNSRKVYQLLYVLATNVPFKPNVTKLSEKIGVHRNTLVQYLYYLEKARLVNSLTAAGKSTSTLQKPDKIFLENTNLHIVLSPEKANAGTLRESFFLNQIRNAGHHVTLPPKTDFYVDEKYFFEVGGKDKKFSQLDKNKFSYVVSDDLEIASLNKIPLWLFGFLY